MYYVVDNLSNQFFCLALCAHPASLADPFSPEGVFSTGLLKMNVFPNSIDMCYIVCSILPSLRMLRIVICRTLGSQYFEAGLS